MIGRGAARSGSPGPGHGVEERDHWDTGGGNVTDSEKADSGKSTAEKIKLYGGIISAVSSLIAIAVFMGWGEQLKEILPGTQSQQSTPVLTTSERRIQPTAPTDPPAEVVKTPAKVVATTEVETTTPTPDPEQVRWDYIVRADAACRTAVQNRPAWVRVLDYDYMAAVLNARNRMMNDWGTVPIEPYEAANTSRIQKIWSDFGNASWYWKYAIDALAANRTADYQTELERYRQANSSFIDGANRYGFRMCNFGWASVSR